MDTLKTTDLQLAINERAAAYKDLGKAYDLWNTLHNQTFLKVLLKISHFLKILSIKVEYQFKSRFAHNQVILDMVPELISQNKERIKNLDYRIAELEKTN